jgi:hypothetical protein
MKDAILAFHIAGEAYRQVLRYRQEMDLRIIQDHLNRKGSAVVSRLKGEDMLGQIHEVPGLGEAVPWYGDFSTGYKFSVQPLEQNCRLRVENTSVPTEAAGLRERPALDLNLPDCLRWSTFEEAELALLARYDAQTSALVRGIHQGRGLPNAGFAFQDDEAGEEIVLRVTPDLLPILENWEFFGSPLSEYEFSFEPLTVGTQVWVRHLGSGNQIDLTGGIDW